MSFSEILSTISADIDTKPHEVVEPVPAKCYTHYLALPCRQCAENQERGYRVTYLAGRCRNGAARDAGPLYHVVPNRTFKAICGAKPSYSSAGWSDHETPGQVATCPKCLKKIKASAA